MCSLFKRVTVPLLAVAAAAALCAPTRAATAAWDVCEADPNSPTGILERVECSMSGPNYWQQAAYNNQLLGGGDLYQYTNTSVDLAGQGDFYDPSPPYTYNFEVVGGGTYNCWCICSGMYYEGPNSGQTWNASTGGTRYVTR